MKKEKRSASKIIGAILFISLALSVIYSAIRLILAPESIAEGSEYTKVKSDYLLMLTQCTLGLIVMTLPSIISRKWKLEIPHFIYLLYYLFLYCSVFLGEVFDFIMWCLIGIPCSISFPAACWGPLGLSWWIYSTGSRRFGYN